jgi:hypothetical protein
LEQGQSVALYKIKVAHVLVLDAEATNSARVVYGRFNSQERTFSPDRYLSQMGDLETAAEVIRRYALSRHYHTPVLLNYLASSPHILTDSQQRVFEAMRSAIEAQFGSEENVVWIIPPEGFHWTSHSRIY